MTQTQDGKSQAKKAAPEVEDLSRDVERAMEKQSDEEVRAVRLFGNFYRCNWWVVEKGQQAVFVQSGRIRRSRFLRATKAPEGVVVEEVKWPA